MVDYVKLEHDFFAGKVQSTVICKTEMYTCLKAIAVMQQDFTCSQVWVFFEPKIILL